MGKAIRGVDFQRGTQGEGNVVIDLSDPSIAPDIQERDGKIILGFAKTQLPEPLRVRLDVKDFATPVQFVNASATGDRATISIEPGGAFDYSTYQTDNKLTVSIRPMTVDDLQKRNAERFAYTGEKLSLNFQDIDVRSVLQLIADFTNLNLVASDTVQGGITLRLQNVPWDQALDLVLKTKGLDKRKIGNVLLVAPADEIAARERQELESQKQIAELAPLRRELLQVNYAKAADIAKLFQSVTSAEAKADERGSITVDERTNNIIAYQTQDRLDELRRIVTQLDIPVRQVMIEARIVEANVDYDKSLGVRWGGSMQNKGNWNTSGVSNGANASSTIGTPGSTSTNSPFVDLGTAANTSGIGIAFITDNVLAGPRADGHGENRQRRNRLAAQGGHVRQGNRENPQGHGDSLSGSQLQRRYLGVVQGGFAVAGSDAADHSGQPDHHGGQGHQGRTGLPEQGAGCTADQEKRGQRQGPGQRRRDHRHWWGFLKYSEQGCR